MDVEFLWFSDCPNHEAAEQMLRDVLNEHRVDIPIRRVHVEDEATALAVRFPGSPTIRINGVDVEPGWEPCEDCTPRCRLYLTNTGTSGLPERDWIVAAVQAAVSS
jgi:hypothetical protein